MEKHFIYWWNLENLFDVEGSPLRPEWLEKELKIELTGWDAAVLNKKLENLCSIVRKFNGGAGPDILGVCEIENENVVQLLADKLGSQAGRSYSVLHKDTKDQRGIDIAFLYDKKKYSTDGTVFSLEVMKRNATRDLVQVHLSTRGGHELILVGNHWPARMDGKFDSEPYRIIVAETLAYWLDRIHEEKGSDASVVLMGDFNDNPYDRSITDYLKASNNPKVVTGAKTNVVLNLMWPFVAECRGTHVFGSEVNVLDQFMVSKSIAATNSKSIYKVEKVEILSFPEQVKGKYNTPIRFGRPSSDFNEKGFSDHLPIELVLSEK